MYWEVTELPLAVSFWLVVYGACHCVKIFPSERQGDAPFSVALRLHCFVIFCLFLALIFICPCLSCPSLYQKQNMLCGCKLSMPNSLNNCSTPRVNVKHKSDSKVLLMPSYNNKHSRFNNWGSRMVDLVVWCNHYLAWLGSNSTYILCLTLQPVI